MHLFLSILREIREGLRIRQSSQDPLTSWALEAALIGRMAEKVERIVTADVVR